MARRQWFTDACWTSQGLLHVIFSFVTNNTSNPVTTTFRGCGGLTGSSGATSVANSGPSAVASITRSGVGTYLVTFSEGYRYAIAALATIEDGADALAVRCAAVANEGAGATTPCTMSVVVRSGATATESTGRRVSVHVVFKDSGNGT